MSREIITSMGVYVDGRRIYKSFKTCPLKNASELMNLMVLVRSYCLPHYLKLRSENPKYGEEFYIKNFSIRDLGYEGLFWVAIEYSIFGKDKNFTIVFKSDDNGITLERVTKDSIQNAQVFQAVEPYEEKLIRGIGHVFLWARTVTDKELANIRYLYASGRMCSGSVKFPICGGITPFKGIEYDLVIIEDNRGNH